MTKKTELYHGILEDYQIEWRRTIIAIDDDNTIIGSRTDRRVLEPGQDVSQFPPRTRALCNFLWTPAVIAAYQAAKSATHI